MKVGIVALFVYTGVFAQPVYELESVVVTGSRIPTKLQELVRSVIIISSEEIKSMPVRSVAELLNYLIDIRQRNIYGVQADPSIRGSSFEQVLVLIDGVPISDPQTGHHNLDIPLSSEDIDRIEIMKGHGSSLYGANAFGGVINIITKKVGSNEISGSYGSYGTYSANFTNTFQIGEFNNRLFLEKQKSDGYRDDTDFDNLTASFGATLKDLFNVALGYTDKDFGAYHFYGPYPSKERTKTKFISMGMSPKDIGNLIVEPKIYYREHYDEFTLEREDPSFYTNYHTNYRYGGELTCYFGGAVFGAEVNEEKIKSTGIRGGTEVSALGEHKRQNSAIYSEYRRRVSNLLANIGSRVDYNSQYGTHLSPSLSMGYLFSDRFKLRSSIGKSFRAPSFTELYYKDPANIGDSTLKAEEGWSYEIGVDYERWIQTSVTIFIRKGKNLIDWVKIDTTLPWEVKNIRKVITKGIEVAVERANFRGDYTFLRVGSELKGNYFSKYALNYPEHQISIKVSQILPYKTEGMIGGVFKKRVNEDEYFTLDTQLSKRINRFSFLIKGTNLLNTRYEDIMGVEMPGIWLTVEIKITLQ